MDNKEILQKIMSEPERYRVEVDNDSIIVQEKHNDKFYCCNGLPRNILIEVLESLGIEAGHI